MRDEGLQARPRQNTSPTRQRVHSVFNIAKMHSLARRAGISGTSYHLISIYLPRGQAGLSHFAVSDSLSL